MYIDDNYNNKECKHKTGIMQGQVGDCYLIAPLLAILYSKIPIAEYLFPQVNYDENSENIQMYIFENGLRKLITFKNTYATYEQVTGDNIKYNQFMFASPLNDSFFGISIEKGYAASKSDKRNIKSGFKNIHGGQIYNAFNSLFGTSSEIFSARGTIEEVVGAAPRDDFYFQFHEDIQVEEKKPKIYKNKFRLDITEEELKNKIKKYLDFDGLINFVIFSNISEAHAFSIIGYKEKKKITNNEFYVEILNPWHLGEYLGNNIKDNQEYETAAYIDKIIFDKEERGNNITEEEFMEDEELYKIYKNYGRTGFLTLKINTFYNWIGEICFCDPMLGYLETIVEIPKYEIDKKNNNKIFFEIEKETKLRAFIFESDKKLNDSKEQIEFFQSHTSLNNKKYYLYIEKYDDIQDKYNYNSDKTKNFSFLIYDKIKPGNYVIEIYPEKIEDNLYLKIQANSLIIKNKGRKDSLSNNEIIRTNCNCTIYYKYPGCLECNFCITYHKYLLINRIMDFLLKLIDYYNNVVYNNNYDYETYNELLPDYIEYYNCISYSHLYFHFMEMQNGFIAIIINKYNFKWEFGSRIEFNNNDQIFSAHFEFGSFSITKNLLIYNYEKDTKFMTLLKTLDYHETTFNLLEVDNFIHKREERIKFDAQIKSQQIQEIQNLEQIRAQHFYELQNMEQIRTTIQYEHNNLEQLKSTKISEEKNLEEIKFSIRKEKDNLEEVKSLIRKEKQNLEDIKLSIKSEQKSLEQLRLTKNTEEKSLEQMKTTLRTEQKKLDELRLSIKDEEQNLEDIQTKKRVEEDNLEEIHSSKEAEENRLSDIKLSINIEQERLDELKTKIKEEEKYLKKDDLYKGFKDKSLKKEDFNVKESLKVFDSFNENKIFLQDKHFKSKLCPICNKFDCPYKKNHIYNK